MLWLFRSTAQHAPGKLKSWGDTNVLLLILSAFCMSVKPCPQSLICKAKMWTNIEHWFDCTILLVSSRLLIANKKNVKFKIGLACLRFWRRKMGRKQQKLCKNNIYEKLGWLWSNCDRMSFDGRLILSTDLHC